MHTTYQRGLVWLRRDLRTSDNTALETALAQCREVHVVFVLDRDILDALPRVDRRVEFILAALTEVDSALRALSANPAGGLIVRHGWPVEDIPRLAAELGVQAVFTAQDYEPVAMQRDERVKAALELLGIHWLSVKDHVLLGPREVLTRSGQPYTVFTPYARNWRAQLQADVPRVAPPVAHGSRLAPRPAAEQGSVPTLAQIGFAQSNLRTLQLPLGMAGAQTLLADFVPRMANYDATRNFPAVRGPSYLSVHLRFGTVSVRQLGVLALDQAQRGVSGAAVWLNELAWRDFYFQILANFPHVASAAFNPAYDRIAWDQGAQADAHFAAWCAGRTGYPLVDAAMLQLAQSGYMHNRLRMVAGSFLVKHLGLDWRRGEAWFAQQLNDFDLSANNGGWQWVASSGCDAQPYFRIFNPVRQSETFDAQGSFIGRYLPQLAGLGPKYIHAPWSAPAALLAQAGVNLGGNYPQPVVDHATARARTLARYAVVRKTGSADPQDASGTVV